MKIHKDARTTPCSRLRMVCRVNASEGITKVTADFCVSGKAVPQIGLTLASGRCRCAPRGRGGCGAQRRKRWQ
jgi:hypothetical protein